MSRTQRIILPDSIYHIFQRGNNHAFIYESDNDKAMFLKTLEETLEKHELSLLYYVIMDNHFHLVVKTGHGSLSQFMLEIQRKYTFRYNLRYQRSGTLYAGRFRSIAVENERQFRQLIHYVAHNPVVADRVRTPDAYPWSAHRIVVDGEVSFVDSDQLLSHFGSFAPEAMRAYQEIVSSNGSGAVARRDCPAMEKCELTRYLDRIMESYPLCSEECEWLRKGECPEQLIELRDSLIRQMRDFGYSIPAIADYLQIDYFKTKRIATTRASVSL